ncbi:HAD-like domain-containing protein [Schizophyllum amplum]|uniref:HAD-like domain-containing protein n=1 Tax=Schizophyllum amplum TaxID=97359 RepID=A0A550CFS9_9AGAR|nr:HAD-like domain-containing protein [Auriculariopsis ampla]
MPKFTDHKAIIFDVYGTLVDWDSTVYSHLKPMLSRYVSSSKWTRAEALSAFADLEAAAKKRYPDMLHHEVLERTYAELEASMQEADLKAGVQEDPSEPRTPSTAEERRAFGRCPKEMVVFPDSVEALKRLAKHFKLVVLSNIDHECFAYTHHRLAAPETYPRELKTYAYPEPNPKEFWYPQTMEGSKSPFTLLLTSQDTLVYKPDHKGFLIAFDQIEKDQDLLGGTGMKAKDATLIVANGLPGNIAPAHDFGMNSIWIDRVPLGEDKGSERIGGKKWTWKFSKLAEMADAVDQELAEQ